MLVIRKIDYSLITYGSKSDSNTNILKSNYHQVVNASTYVWRTTPINNIIMETGLPTLKKRVYELKAIIIPKLLNSGNAMLGEDVETALIAKRITTYRHRCCKRNRHFSKHLSKI